MKNDAPVYFLVALLDAVRPLQSMDHVPPSYLGPKSAKAAAQSRLAASLTIASPHSCSSKPCVSAWVKSLSWATH